MPIQIISYNILVTSEKQDKKQMQDRMYTEANWDTSWIAVSIEAAVFESRKSGCPEE